MKALEAQEALNRHDDHYKQSVVEPIRVMQVFFTREEFMGYLKGNILKYRLRLGLKGSDADAASDLDKIKVYEEWLRLAKEGKPIL